MSETARMMEGLKPCPFCGSGDISFEDAAMGHSMTYCNGCGAAGPEGSDDDDAEAKWNTRASQGQSE